MRIEQILILQMQTENKQWFIGTDGIVCGIWFNHVRFTCMNHISITWPLTKSKGNVGFSYQVVDWRILQKKT